MKFLLIVFIVMVLVFQWRSSRSDAKRRTGAKPDSPPPGKEAARPLAMVACAQCGLHVPAMDAVHGKTGDYCSTSHRQLREP